MFRVEPGRSLFLGGLVRFDYETIGGHNVKNLLLLTWYGVLPGHLTKTASMYALAFYWFTLIVF